MPELPDDSREQPQPSQRTESAEMRQQILFEEIESDPALTVPTTNRTAPLRAAVFGPQKPDSSDQPSPTPKTASKSTDLEDKEKPKSLWARIRASATQGKAHKKAPSRESLRQNKTPMLLGGGALIFGMGVWFLYLVSAPVRQPPAKPSTETTATTQVPPAKRSTTPGTEAQTQPPPGTAADKGVTPADIRATAEERPIRTPPSVPAVPAKDANDNDPPYVLGRIPPPASVPPAPAVSVATATSQLDFGHFNPSELITHPRPIMPVLDELLGVPVGFDGFELRKRDGQCAALPANADAQCLAAALFRRQTDYLHFFSFA